MRRIKYGIWCLLIVISLMAGGITAYAEGEGKAAAAREGVVRILVDWPDGYSTGTGFGVGEPGADADTFVTNWHVVTSSGQYDYREGKVYILLDDETWFKYGWIPLAPGEQMVEGGDYGQDGQGNVYKKLIIDVHLGAAVECEVLYAENDYPDVAVIRTAEPVKNVKTLPLRKVSEGNVGEDVLAIGYPGSADSGSLTYTEDGAETEKIKASVTAVSVSGGVVSRCIPLEIFGNTDCIVHGAHINHGNSGGPLVLKKDGSVIGINTYGYGEQSMEYSVSIYIDYAIGILDQLGLPYTMAKDGGQGLSGQLVIILAGVGILAVLAVVLVVVRKKQKGKAAVSAGSPAAVPAFQPAPGPSGGDAMYGAPSQLRLQGLTGVFAGRRFQLKPETRMGRDPQRCDFVYPAGTKGISGLHCIISQGPAGLTVTDVGSTWGTTVNGTKLVPNQPCPLNIGDRICLGSVEEEFQITGKGGAV